MFCQYLVLSCLISVFVILFLFWPNQTHSCMCVYMYVFVHIQIPMHARTHIYTHLQAHTDTHTHTYLCPCTWKHTVVYMQLNTHARTHTCTHAHVYVHMHACAHTCKVFLLLFFYQQKKCSIQKHWRLKIQECLFHLPKVSEFQFWSSSTVLAGWVAETMWFNQVHNLYIFGFGLTAL